MSETVHLVPVQLVNQLLADWEPFSWSVELRPDGIRAGREPSTAQVTVGRVPLARHEELGIKAPEAGLTVNSDLSGWWKEIGVSRGTGCSLTVSLKKDRRAGKNVGYRFKGRYGSVLLDSSWVPVSSVHRSALRDSIGRMLDDLSHRIPYLWCIESVAGKLVARLRAHDSPHAIQKLDDELHNAESTARRSREYLKALHRLRDGLTAQEVRHADESDRPQASEQEETIASGGIPFDTPFGRFVVTIPASQEGGSEASRRGDFKLEVAPVSGSIRLKSTTYSDFALYFHRDRSSMKWESGPMIRYRGGSEEFMAQVHRSQIISTIAPACVQALNRLPRTTFLKEELTQVAALVRYQDRVAQDLMARAEEARNSGEVVAFTRAEINVLLAHPRVRVRELGILFLGCPVVTSTSPGVIEGEHQERPALLMRQGASATVSASAKRRR